MILRESLFKINIIITDFWKRRKKKPARIDPCGIIKLKMSSLPTIIRMPK